MQAKQIRHAFGVLYWTCLTLVVGVVFLELLLHDYTILASTLYAGALLCGVQVVLQLICLGTRYMCGKTWKRRAAISSLWFAAALVLFYVPEWLP